MVEDELASPKKSLHDSLAEIFGCERSVDGISREVQDPQMSIHQEEECDQIERQEEDPKDGKSEEDDMTLNAR